MKPVRSSSGLNLTKSFRKKLTRNPTKRPRKRTFQKKPDRLSFKL